MGGAIEEWVAAGAEAGAGAGAGAGDSASWKGVSSHGYSPLIRYPSAS